MSNENPILNDSYRRYASLLLRHHDLLCDGKHETDEAETVEDEMNQLWNELDSVQQQSLSGLSSDLNWVRRGGRIAPRAKPADEVTDAEIDQVFGARDIGNWNSVLRQLRICGARLPATEIARLRSTAWQKLGFPEISCVFGSFAAEIETIQASRST